MASILNQPKDKDEKDEAGMPVGPQPAASPTESRFSGQAGTGPAPAGQTGPTSSGRYTNIQKYLHANRNYNKDQGGLAGSMTGKIKDQSQKVQDQVVSAQTQVQDQARQAQSGWGYDPSLIANAAANPLDVANNEEQAGQIANMAGASYSGPQSLADTDAYGNIISGVQGVQQQADMSRSQQGRYELLRQMFNRPTYTSGQRRFDNLLVQGNRQQQDALLSGAQQAATGVSGALDSANSAVSTLAGTMAEEAARVRDEVSTTLGGASKDLSEKVDADLKAAEEARKTANEKIEQIKHGFGAGHISDELATELGLSPQALAKELGLSDPSTLDLYGVDPSQYFKYNTTSDPTREGVMSKEQAAKLNALLKLQGKDPIYDESGAGSFQQSSFNFDRDGFVNSVKDAKNRYTENLNKMTSSYGPTTTYKQLIEEIIPHFTRLRDSNHQGAAAKWQQDLDLAMKLAAEDRDRFNTQHGHTGNKLKFTPGNMVAAAQPGIGLAQPNQIIGNLNHIRDMVKG